MSVPLGFELEEHWGSYFNLPAFLPTTVVTDTLGMSLVSSSDVVSTCAVEIIVKPRILLLR
jgi:hypothetical protein